MHRTMGRTAVVLAWGLALATPAARAAGDPPPIPQFPSTPPGWERKIPVDAFLCKRAYIYQGKFYTCDSNLNWDGENLRAILQDVPASLTELNLYQRNRNQVKTLGYYSSIGLGLTALTYLVSRSLDGNTGLNVRRVGFSVGLSLAAGSFIYGFSLLKTNEQHLGRAVEAHNQAHPESPIELQFSTGIQF